MKTKPQIVACMALLVSFLGGGCGRGKEPSYVPTDEDAQSILRTVLTAWKDDKLSDLLLKSSPIIHLIDTQRQPHRKLTAFSVLGPTTGDAQRCYAVRLTLNNPREEVRARFVVMGIDPLWVLRYEDYEMISHWDCPPEKPNK